MSKRQHQTAAHPKSRVNTSISVGTENSGQFQPEQAGTVQSSTDTGFTPTYEDIQKRAYQIHNEKGGSEFENWLEAEKLLKEEHQSER